MKVDCDVYIQRDASVVIRATDLGGTVAVNIGEERYTYKEGDLVIFFQSLKQFKRFHKDIGLEIKRVIRERKEKEDAKLGKQ